MTKDNLTLPSSDGAGLPLGGFDGKGSSPDWAAILAAIVEDERYKRNLDWGKPRSGHPEGKLRAHIEELETNLQALRPRLTPDEIAKLEILIHTHDTFKADALPGAAIEHAQSHASLARSFLAERTPDAALLAITQYHDEPYALWLQARGTGVPNPHRWQRLLETISDWDLFLAFQIIDNCTAGKDRAPIRWLFARPDLPPARFTAADIL